MPQFVFTDWWAFACQAIANKAAYENLCTCLGMSKHFLFSWVNIKKWTG